MEHRSTRRRLATAGLTACLVATGAFAGATLGAPVISGAQDTEETPTTVAPDETTTDADHSPEVRLGEVLAPLVEDGTINQEQADAVIAALVEAGPPPGAHMLHHRGPDLDAAATALGITTDELATALEDGSSLADVAAAQGVDVQTVIDAMVAEVTAHLDEEVASGELTQEEADAKLADATEAITAMVNGELPARGPGFGFGMGGPGHHGPFGGPDDAADTTTS